MSETDRPHQPSASLDRAPIGTSGSSAGDMHPAYETPSALPDRATAARQDSRRAHLLARDDWVFVLGLLIPFAVYDLGLRSRLVWDAPGETTLASRLGLLQSPLLFLAGYAALWIGLFATTRTPLLRWIFRVAFQALTVLVALFMAGAYQYFRATGATLDAHYLRFWLSFPDGTAGAIAAELHYSIQALILGVLVYGMLGPPLLVFLAGLWRARDTDMTGVRPIWRRVLGIELLALLLFGFSMLPGGAASVSASFARHAFVNLLTTAAQIAKGEESLAAAASAQRRSRPLETRFLPTSATERRNVVLIFLESTRASATTPYNSTLQTTPFMAELAQHSLLVENAYAIIAHTHNALTASNCGTDPPLDPLRTVELINPQAVPAPCLPHLLRAQGYNTVFFMSHTKAYEDSQSILTNLGYQDFYSNENMDTRGFEETYYWGYEDEIMLEPSRKWLQKHRNKPFLASYLTSAPHHDYRAPSTRNGRVEFAENDQFNRYLNAVRNQDFFLKQLFDQYKALGLYENTVFFVLGDHGEGFGEHGGYGHDSVIYEEGMRIPMLVHDPRRFKQGARVEQPVNQLDILPTVADLLGYTIQGGAFSGSSLMKPLPEDRVLRMSCWAEQGCLASLEGSIKYIYYFDDRPEELFDLAADSRERHNLARQRPAEELKRRRGELLEWRAQVRARYKLTNE